MTSEKGMSRTAKGMIFAIIASVLWATAGLAIKMASRHMNSEMVVFAGRVIGFVAFSPVIFLNVRREGTELFKMRRPRLLLLRAACSIGASYCLYYALHYLSLTSAILLSYTRPLFLPLIVWIVYRKRLEPVIWISLALGFIGVVLILEPGFDFTHPATLVGLGAGLIGACASLVIRRLAKTEPADSITFHYFWMSVLIAGIPLIWGWELPTLNALPWLIFLGVFIVLYQMCLSRAYSYSRASIVGAVLYCTLIFSSIYDWLIWDNEPNLYTLIGIILVVGSSLMAILLSRKPA